MVRFAGQWLVGGISLGPQDLVECVQLSAESNQEVRPHEEGGFKAGHYADEMLGSLPPDLYREGTHTNRLEESLGRLRGKQAMGPHGECGK